MGGMGAGMGMGIVGGWISPMRAIIGLGVGLLRLCRVGISLYPILGNGRSECEKREKRKVRDMGGERCGVGLNPVRPWFARAGMMEF